MVFWMLVQIVELDAMENITLGQQMEGLKDDDHLVLMMEYLYVIKGGAVLK